MNVALSRLVLASANLDAANSLAPKRSELLIASACFTCGESFDAAEAFVALAGVAFVRVMLYRADAGGSIGRAWTGPGVTK